MAKFAKILLISLVIFSLISFSSLADPEAVPSSGSCFGIWNTYSQIFKTGFATSQVEIYNWADAAYTPTFVTVGFGFDMLPDLTYEVKYTITSRNDTKFNWIDSSRGKPVATYLDKNISLTSQSYDFYLDNLVEFSDGLAITTQINSAGAQSSWNAEFSSFLVSKKQLTDKMIYITFSPDVTALNQNNRSYQLLFQGLNIYYDPNDISAETLSQLAEQTELLRDLGVKVDSVNTSITDLDTTVQNGIKDVNSKIDNVGEDVADNLANKEKEEGSAAQEDAMKDADEQASELNEADEVGKLDVVGKLTQFWNVFSSTETATSFTFPGATNPFTGSVLWYERNVDLSVWLNNSFVKMLLSVVRLITSLGLLWWVFKLYYDMINAVLNKDSERSIIQVVLGMNPFK